jgi:23S rRNA (uracil1939-C5)-methyltransferase
LHKMIPKIPINRKQEHLFHIEKMAFGGKGITHLDNFVVFIKDTLPGDVVRACIMKKKANYAEGRLLEIITPSPMRIQPPCPYFNWCGGCSWQNIEYEQQLDFKHQHVRETVQHIAGFDKVDVLSPLPSKKIWAYRNKMEFSFSDRRWFLPDELGKPNLQRSFVLGLHVPGTFDKIINIDRCLLQSDTANEALQTIYAYCKQQNLVPYSLKFHTGFLRFLVMRGSHTSGELMINIVTAYEDTKQLVPLAKYLMNHFPAITSFVNTINGRKAQVAYGDKELLIAGKRYIIDRLFDLSFKISANSFFQTNTMQAEYLYKTVLEMCDPKPADIIWDLYCGTGTITLFLARHAKKVIGFELASSSISDAKKNAQVHGMANIMFIAGDLADNLEHCPEKPDIIVVDPPRSGMHPKVTRLLSRVKAGKIIYVSCNPTTMARDLLLLGECYQPELIQPIDMFPHTYHIESVVRLTRKNK